MRFFALHFAVKSAELPTSSYLLSLGSHREIYICGVVDDTYMKSRLVVLLCSRQQMKELNHDNIVLFVGVCIEPGNVCIVVQHCSRGTLQVG